MKIETGLPVGNLRAVPDAARRLESLGYDGAVTPEINRDPFLPLALAATTTDRITLGTAVAIAFPRSPMTVALTSWDLQRLSGGRFILGLGTQVKGHNQRRYSVQWVPPGPRLREYILSLRAIWNTWQTGAPLDFQGKHYTFTLMTPEFNPGPIDHPHVPVHIAAVNDYNCRLAGELCDGIRIHGFTTKKYTEEVILPNVEAGAKKAGRSLKDIHVSGGGFIAAGANDEEVTRAVQDVKTRIAFYGSTRTYKPVLDIHGWGDTALKLHELSVQGRWSEMPALITDEMAETFAVIGTYDDIAPKLRRRYQGIADSIGLGLPARTPEEEARLRRLLAEVRGIPAK